MNIVDDAETLIPGGGWVKLALKVAPWAIAAIIIGVLWFKLSSAKADAASWQSKFTIEKGQFALLESGYREKAAEALADDLQHARAVEAAQEDARKEAENDYAPKLAEARSNLAAYIARMRVSPAGGQADRSGGATANVPVPAGSTGYADGGDQDPWVYVRASDLDACTEAVNRLINIRDTWWPKVVAVKP